MDWTQYDAPWKEQEGQWTLLQLSARPYVRAGREKFKMERFGQRYSTYIVKRSNKILEVLVIDSEFASDMVLRGHSERLHKIQRHSFFCHDLDHLPRRPISPTRLNLSATVR